MMDVVKHPGFQPAQTPGPVTLTGPITLAARVVSTARIGNNDNIPDTTARALRPTHCQLRRGDFLQKIAAISVMQRFFFKTLLHQPFGFTWLVHI